MVKSLARFRVGSVRCHIGLRLGRHFPFVPGRFGVDLKNPCSSVRCLWLKSLQMLTTLRIKNLALVADLTLELQPGCNVITGETGAGKSIIIGALDLVLGERADRTLIRSGEESCSVEAMFDVTSLFARQSERRAPPRRESVNRPGPIRCPALHRRWVNFSKKTALNHARMANWY